MNFVVRPGNPDAVMQKRLRIFPAGKHRGMGGNVNIVKKVVHRFFTKSLLEVQNLPDVTQKFPFLGPDDTILRDEQEKSAEALASFPQVQFHYRSLTSYRSVLRSSQFRTEPVCRWRLSSSRSTSSTMTVSMFGVHSDAMASRVNGMSDGVRIADCAYWMSRLSTDGRLLTVPAIAVYTWFSTHRA